jgi:pectate lyase
MRYPTRQFIVSVFLVLSSFARAAVFYVAPTGSDRNPGTEAQPFATLMGAQTAASTGDTVLIRGGTYTLTNAHITRDDGLYIYVNDFTKPGISYLAYEGETPVFNFSQVLPTARRITAFFIRTNDLVFRGFHVVGVQVVIRTGESTNTQSENFRIRNGSRNRLERMVLRDGMGIGVYIINNSADNLVLNCDAYNNAGLDSLSMGNVDGFGAHTTSSGTGNVFRGCRAWLNSDDGFDLINCTPPVLIENCWAAFSGYRNAALQTGGDGNGFKAGGYGRNGSVLPAVIPRHVVRTSLAIHNRASGFYANHHPGGLDFINNTAFRNSTNYNFLNVLADNLTNVPGYGHVIKNNLSHSPRSTAFSQLDAPACDVAANSFSIPLTATNADFLFTTTNTTELLAALSAPRRADGSLPEIRLLRLRAGSQFVDRGVNVSLPFQRTAPDIGCFELSPFEDWIGSRLPGVVDPNQIGESVDPDGDGVANLVEYFAGSNPLVPDVSAAFTIRTGFAGGIHLNARRQKLADGIAHRVEHSSNLASWSDAAFSLVEEQDLGTHIELGAEVPAASAAGFWRLSVSRVSP